MRTSMSKNCSHEMQSQWALTLWSSARLTREDSSLASGRPAALALPLRSAPEFEVVVSTTTTISIRVQHLWMSSTPTSISTWGDNTLVVRGTTQTRESYVSRPKCRRLSGVRRHWPLFEPFHSRTCADGNTTDLYL